MNAASTPPTSRTELTPDDLRAWHRRIERDELGPLLALDLIEVLKRAPDILDEALPVSDRARLIVLVGAQLHPAAVAWLACAATDAAPALRPLARHVYEESRTRYEAAMRCLRLMGG